MQPLHLVVKQMHAHAWAVPTLVATHKLHTLQTCMHLSYFAKRLFKQRSRVAFEKARHTMAFKMHAPTHNTFNETRVVRHMRQHVHNF